MRYFLSWSRPSNYLVVQQGLVELLEFLVFEAGRPFLLVQVVLDQELIDNFSILLGVGRNR